MSQDDRPQDGTPVPDDADRTPEQPPSVLSGFSWDDPDAASPGRTGAGAASAADQGPEDPSSTGPTPAAYPPPAPYPPAGGYGADPSPSAAPPADPAAERPRVTLDKPSSSDPYTAPAGPPAQPGHGAPGPGTPGYAQGYGTPGYGGPVAPEQGAATQAPYGQQVPYGQGYGPSASYTTTPQPYAYGPPPLSPEAEKVRSSAVLWTVLNGVAIFLCGNLLSIGGVILAALAIGRSREDVPAARGLVKWSWILFAVGFAFWLLIIIGYVVFFIVLGTAGMSGGF